MAERENKESKKNHPDRPIECTECKRPIVVHYTEIAEGKKILTGMCSECPVLQSHLHGMKSVVEAREIVTGKTGLACGECGTTLDAIRMGTTLGCSNCYEVFGDMIVSELLLNHTLSHQFTTTKRSETLHFGRQPGEKQTVSSSLRLIALNEALAETLKHEDYEQAARLRDQIKQLTEKPEKSDDKKK